MGTTFIRENEGNEYRRTVATQLSAVFAREMRFPHTVRFRSMKAVIYGHSEAYPFYRLALRVGGKRVVRSFQTFEEASAK